MHGVSSNDHICTRNGTGPDPPLVRMQVWSYHDTQSIRFAVAREPGPCWERT